MCLHCIGSELCFMLDSMELRYICTYTYICKSQSAHMQEIESRTYML